MRQLTTCCLILLLTIGTAVAGGVIVNDDLYLGIWTPIASRWETRVPVCIWSEDESAYRISVSGASVGRRFMLNNDIGDQVWYRVYWHTGKNYKKRERLRPTIPSRRAYAFSPERNCTDGFNAQIRVRVSKRQIDRAPPGIYNDTLLLILSPL